MDMSEQALDTPTPTDAGRLRLLSAAFARLRLSMAAMPAMGFLFGGLLAWLGGNPRGFFVWGALYLPALWYAWHLLRRYRREQLEHPPADLLAAWQPRVQRLALAHGVALASTVVLPMGTASYDFMLLVYAALMGTVAVNAAQMSASWRVYRAFFFGMGGSLVLMPWAFESHWYFTLPIALVMMVVIYRSAIHSHRFFVRQVALEEHSRDLAERYRQASSAAEMALAEKNRFLSTAAHDLRQPVHAMGLLAEAIALHGKDIPRLEGLLTQWRLSMRSVSHMFDALLDLSRIESGAVELRPAALPLQGLFDDIHTQFAAEAGARRLALRLHRPPPHATVLADPALARQSLANLVHNALRYTPHGGVLVGARQRGRHWRIEVWDTGVGVALEEQGQIYQAFYRPHHAWQLHRSGHGLGLAVVARCVALMGARQGLRSRLGKGSCFWVELPAAEAPSLAEQLAPLGAQGHHSPLPGRCLVLDDDPHVLGAWAALLGTWEVEVRLASNAGEAFAHIEAGFTPQAILCDQRLRSGESGFEVLLALLERCPDAHGAMVSGEFDAPELQEADAQGYLVLRKPVDADTLHALLAQWLRAPGS
ncbi:signal transduction histidine kinase [Acidovorax sp. CF316]|nr:signal transduction histidine kinase [Acidovorax sp. CF316]